MMEEIIKKAKELALSEIKQYGTPILPHFYLSFKKGQELAEKLRANMQIVEVGTYLMDVKLGQCYSENRLSDHIKLGVEKTKEFLSQFDIDEETKNKILNCVEMHHGGKYSCKEAEICANADCFRFIHPRGVFAFMHLLGIRNEDPNAEFKYVEQKMDEKWSILSLDICKKELETYYRDFKKLITVARGL